MAIAWPTSPANLQWFDGGTRGWYRYNASNTAWELWGIPIDRVIHKETLALTGPASSLATATMQYFVVFDSGKTIYPTWTGSAGYPTTGTWQSSDTTLAPIHPTTGDITWGPGSGAVTFTLSGSPAPSAPVSITRPVDFVSWRFNTLNGREAWSWVGGPTRSWQINFAKFFNGSGATGAFTVTNSNPSVATIVSQSTSGIQIAPLSVGVTTLTFLYNAGGSASQTFTFEVFSSDPTV